MPDAPMSRRARRTFEQEAAERAASNDPTRMLAPDLSSGETPDLSQLSRRDRRRLERLSRPLEAWTAEEEMLATGQIPAMTPERIAEQERISREKALRAAQDAASASQELRVLAEAEAKQTAWTGAQPRHDVPAEPVEYQPVMMVDSTPLAPVSHAHRQAKDAAGFGVEPQGAVESQPAHAEVLPEATPMSMPIETPTETPGGGFEAADRARVLDELFPAGSDQAALRQHDPFAQVAATREPTSSPSIPTLLPPVDTSPAPVNAWRAPVDASPAPVDASPTPTDAVEEIRRLAAEAMSGLERASRAEDAAADRQPYQEPPSQPTPWEQLAPSPQAPSSLTFEQAQVPQYPAQSMHEPRATEPPSVPDNPQLGATWEQALHVDAVAAAPDLTFAAYGEPRTGEHAPVSTPPGGLAPHHAVFDQVASAQSGATYVGGIDERRQATASGQFPGVQSGQFPVQGAAAPVGVAPQPLTEPQGPVWATHPLEAVEAARPNVADPNDFKPVADAPRPDFSGLYQASTPSPFGPVSGTTPTAQYGSVSGAFPPESTTTNTTGTIRRLEMPDVGGAKHFKWLHLAVIGALMFVLGVVIYNAAFAQ